MGEMKLFDNNEIKPEMVLDFETLSSEDCIRVNYIYGGYMQGYYTEEECMEAFKKWLKQDTFVVLKRVVEEPTETKVEYIFTKTAKRGNDVYAYKQKKNFKQIGLAKTDLKKPQVEVYVDVDGNEIKTNCVFGTLTFNPGEISKKEAWDIIGEEWNKFISRLRREFEYLGDKGRIKLEDIYVFRSWESHKSGYPHIHFVLVFRNTTFLGFKRYNKEGKIEYRLNETYRQKIKKCWKYGFSDLMIPVKVKVVKDYIFKYITKAVDLETATGEDNLTLMYSWLFGKRMYSWSKYIKFRDEPASPCLDNMTNSNKSVQISLDGEQLTRISYYYLGIATSISATKWHYEFQELPENIELRRKKENFGIRDIGFA